MTPCTATGPAAACPHRGPVTLGADTHDLEGTPPEWVEQQEKMMTDKIDDGGPAFAAMAVTPSGNVYQIDGMSLRAWIAGQVLSGYVGQNPNLPGDPASAMKWPKPEELAARRAAWAVLQADALIAALKGGA